MKILLANDDGIQAEGLQTLERIATNISADVTTVAPEQEQSGAGHSLSLHNPVRMRKVGERRFAVSGTPTDCVMLGAQEVLKGEKIDLLLSGVNRGSNVGDDMTYSGTVAAAMEATLLNIPAMALSQLYHDDGMVHFETAETHAPALIQKLLKYGWPKSTLMNLNFPDCAPGAVKGIKLCAQGKRVMRVKLDGRTDPKGRPYYWIGGMRENVPDRENVDVDLLEQGYITVTPIQLDMTDYRTLAELEKEINGNDEMMG